jgi:hypothetical protein
MPVISLKPFVGPLHAQIAPGHKIKRAILVSVGPVAVGDSNCDAAAGVGLPLFAGQPQALDDLDGDQVFLDVPAGSSVTGLISI